ncbi:MAG: hypothetical protein V4498_07400 [candidate division FCPU426 bacterium]
MPIGKPFIERKMFIAMREESESGTAETTPVDADTRCILFEPSYDLMIDKIEQLVYTGGYTELEALIGQAVGEFSLSHDLRLGLEKPEATVLAVPQIDRILKGCGLKATPSTLVTTYTPDSDEDNGKTYTVWFFILNPDADDICIAFKGCKGALQNKFSPAKPFTVTAKFRGTLFFADVWADSTPAYEADPGTQLAPVILSGIMSADGDALSCVDVMLDDGNSLVPVEDGSDVGGVLFHHIGDRKAVKYTFKVRADLQGGAEKFLQRLQQSGQLAALVFETQTVAVTLSAVDYLLKWQLVSPKFNVKTLKKDKIGDDLAWSVEGTPLQDGATFGSQWKLTHSVVVDT